MNPPSDNDRSRQPDRSEQKTEAVRESARSQREYGHSSGDRNTRHDEDDAPSLTGGEKRDATPDDKDELTP